MKNDIIFGKNSVEALLKSEDRSVNKLYILSTNKNDNKLKNILRLAKINKIPISEISKSKLENFIESGVNHQGVLASVSPVDYADLDDILEEIKAKEKKAMLILLDGIEDPQNLGSIIRSAEIFNADAVVITKRRSASITNVVAKTSSGAIEFMPVAQVNNISSTIEKLKKEGIWVIGAEYTEKSTYLYNLDFDMPCAIVMGSEGKGLSKLVKENCDILVKIPQYGKTNSLNVANALSIILYEISRQKQLKVN